MLDITDFSIGDYVIYKDKIIRIFNIDEDANVVNRVPYRYGIRSECRLDDIRPIRVTGEMLVNLGFFKHPTTHECSKDVENIKISIQIGGGDHVANVFLRDKNVVYKDKEVRLDNINYFHELQRAFRSIGLKEYAKQIKPITTQKHEKNFNVEFKF